MPPLIIVIACFIVFAPAIVAWHVYRDARRHRSEDAEMLEHLRRSINWE